MRTFVLGICSRKRPTVSLMTFAFALGIAAHGSFYMFLQDWLGLEGYIAMVQTGWKEIPWWVGACICSGCITVFLSVRHHLNLILEYGETLKEEGQL